MKEDKFKYYREYRKNVILEKKETLLQMIRRVIKEHVNESLDGGDYTFIKEDSFKYYVIDNNNEKIAVVNFRLEFDVSDLKKEYYNLESMENYYSVSWDFINSYNKDYSHWMKVTGVVIKIVGDFIKNVRPNLILFTSTENTKKTYESENFINILNTLFKPNYRIRSYKVGDIVKIIIYKPEVFKLDESSFEKNRRHNCHLSEKQVIDMMRYKRKKYSKGVSYKEDLNEQIKRIIHRVIYL